MKKAFWHNSTIAVLGAGAWGTALTTLVAKNAKEIRMWMRSEEQARAINSTRSNPHYVQELIIPSNVMAYHNMEKVFSYTSDSDRVRLVIWGLPSNICREKAKELAPFLQGDELILHATKGVEEGTLKRISTVLEEELPTPRIGVISGPNLAGEIARNQPAATVVASRFREVVEAGEELLRSDALRVYGSSDIIGVEWAGALKNILAIASGAIDALGLGWNVRAMMITRGLAEMVRFSLAMGARSETFLGLAGVGDLLATCGSALSRNYRVGYGLSQGRSLEQVMKDLGSTAEGVRTAKIVWKFAEEKGISMPITEAVYQVLEGNLKVRDTLPHLMSTPNVDPEIPEFGPY